MNINAVQAYRNSIKTTKTQQANASFKDTLEISTKAQQMQSTKTYDVERAEKLESLKEKVNSGEYKVDAKKVAEDMLNYYRFK